MGKIISFTNQKGGVGKTTTCVNVSAYLAAMGKKVLLIDLDPQGNATSGLGVDKNANTKTIYNVIDGDAYIEEVILPTCVENLSIIPATVDLAGAEIDLVQMPNRENVLKTRINRVKDEYNFIFIDCPPSLGLLTVNALTASNSVLIPIQCEFYALEGLTQLMNTIKLVRKHLNTGLDVEGVVLTMKIARSNSVNQVSEEITNFFGKKVFKTIIPRNIRLAEAPSYGLPVGAYDYNSKGAKAYLELSEELLERNGVDFEKISTKIKTKEGENND
ncbi:MAG: ParA family protein [Clostridia bacterium]|nr:ParA family protein [Clostridia bacterium]